MFEVTVDRVKQRVVMNITKFFDLVMALEKDREITDGVEELLRRSPHFDLLVCLEGIGPLSQEVSEHMDAMIGRFVAKGLRKSAHVGFTALAKMQMQRLTGNDDRFRFFSNVEEASAWLDE